jgi:hydrogenase expression/formation protein HypC
MCLAIPAQITELKDNNMVEVNILGATREASIDLTPTAKVGDYVLVHAGFAIEIVDPEFAEETLELVKQFPEMVAEEVPEAASKQAV